MKVVNYKSSKYTYQRGLSLIELMIAIPIGILLILAVIQVFTNSLISVYSQNAFARVQENGRMASALITRDIRGAGNWGCIGSNTGITSHLDTSSGNYDDAILPISGAIDGENDVSAMTIDNITVRDSTDILTLRGAKSFTSASVVAPYLHGSFAKVNVISGHTFAKGDLILLSDCRQADLFTNMTDSNSEIENSIGAVANGIPNISASFLTSYEAGTQILEPYAKAYFIGENSPNSFSLYRSDNGTANELVRGVNDMQLMFGIDSTGNGSADTFLETPPDMNNVVSVRVTLIAESGDSSSGTPITRAYQVTANIRNRTLQ